MVSANPLFRGTWTLKKFQATVINDIWPEVAFFTLVAMGKCRVTLANEKTDKDVFISNSLLTVLGTVLGLVISFRTSSAYERYQDGRKMWTNIITASRNLAQQIWIHVPNDRAGKGANTTQLQNMIEKKSMLNLIIAFSVSVKHFLRGERGVYYADLYPLISFLPRYSTGYAGDEVDKLPLWCEDDEHDGRKVDMPPTELARESSGPSDNNEKSLNGDTLKSRGHTHVDMESAMPIIDSERPLKPARNPPESSIFDYIPLLRFFKWVGRKLTGRARPPGRGKRRAHHEYVESNIPIEIILVLSNYTAICMRNGLVQPAIATGLSNNLTVLQDTLSNLERICNTPLPFAYQAHLRMSLWLYLLFLPFQVYSQMKWVTIPGTAFASFLLLGFLEIGQEIENPFNYDLNDLDLDYFCSLIQRESHLISAHPAPDPSEFLFTEYNQPFAPSDRRTAKELVEGGSQYTHPATNDGVQPGLASLRRTLVKGWKEVDSLAHGKTS